MIKLKHIETTGWGPAFRGMRNPLQSHAKSDSHFENILGPNDLNLALKLIKAGASHRKFLRMINIYVDITANLKWWDEFDTYLHTVKNSTSQMHSLLVKKFEPSDFSWKFSHPEATAIMNYIIEKLNKFRKAYLAETNKNMQKQIWRNILELLPQSYLYTRTTMLNYEVFITQYFNRKNHKMSEWIEYCKVLREKLPYMDEFLLALEEKG